MQRLPFEGVRTRVPLREGVDIHAKVKVVTMEKIFFGDEEINLSAVEQLTEVSQTKFIADCLVYLGKDLMDGRLTTKQLLDILEARLAKEGDSNAPGLNLDVVSDRCVGWYAGARRFEIAAALNRLRTVRFKLAS